MIDDNIIRELARAVCFAEGLNPDEWPPATAVGPYGLPFPSFAPDGISRPWHKFVDAARQFLAMQRHYNTYFTFDGLKP